MTAKRNDMDEQALAEAERPSGGRPTTPTATPPPQKHPERRLRTEARLRCLERAKTWDDEGFWQQHAAEKGGS
ncbi:type II toxin-antitoxin system VapB family antitoxin [Streptomyces sp. NPDC090025]|uniref:type II toxin-antitoxin system VapB family antitoxin n=1 Tax=Streptomyces sp. NPDC090025 TaxID=3365922 RepID=UPI0038383D73